MERIWCLFSYWQPYGNCHQQDPAVFYVRFHSDNGVPDYYIYDPGFLAEYEEVYVGGEKKSLVLFVVLR